MKTKNDIDMTTTSARAEAGAPGLSAADEWWPVETPVGRLVLAGDDKALHFLCLPQDQRRESFLTQVARRGRPTSVAKAEEQLQAYFAGELREFDLPLAPRGTPWQQNVWSTLTKIPFAETRSYGEVAREAGNPRASRAVGSANNRNPIALIIPCHRVIGADGSLTGYGGGLALKEQLLRHEREVLHRSG
ncbi:MAG TPA: methylated-DNA--[protein]-cysteine S-methyltransferase [Acidimicrobiales bacterium]|nr:methylated-DNA--[protein]-cysteine S-methyltransferase [Acidimicrobiales bacterium]